MEMLHGSDGWEKLASELQQKEEDEAQHSEQPSDVDEMPLARRLKRGRCSKEGSEPRAHKSR